LLAPFVCDLSARLHHFISSSSFRVAPPEHAVVLCVDEKNQIQTLDRSQPILPTRPGQVARRSHDDKRH
jgi:hypothetical protein